MAGFHYNTLLSVTFAKINNLPLIHLAKLKKLVSSFSINDTRFLSNFKGEHLSSQIGILALGLDLLQD